MPTLPNMGLITPTLGGDSGQWDDKINACFALVDAHDHTSGKGLAVPVAGLDIDADLPLAGFGLTNLGKISFTTIAAPSSGSKNLFVNSADNELYWRTNSGTNVKLTSGTSINTTLVGGIVGDYSSVGAEVAYDDANDRYTFKQQGTKPWARIASGPVRIFEFNTTESVYVELAAPSALAASYSITLPLAAPSRTSPVTMTSAGILTADDSTRSLHVSGLQALDAAAAHTKQRNGYGLAASTGALYYPIDLTDGDQIIGFKLYCRKTTNGADTITAQLAKIDDTSVTVTALGSGASNNGNNPGFITLTETLGAPEAIVTGGTQYQLVFTPGGATAANHSVFHLEVLYKRG